MHMSKIKICGLTRPSDIETVNLYRPDYAGFVFAKSRRQVTVEQAQRLKRLLLPEITAVGVFADDEPDRIADMVNDGIIDMIQLHGNENEAYISYLKSSCRAPIIRAVKVTDEASVRRWCDSKADYLLLDNSAAGSGQCFDWKYIKECQRDFFLAGGINIGNIAEALSYGPFAVDVSSGAETEGVKDKELIRQLVNAVRK